MIVALASSVQMKIQGSAALFCVKYINPICSLNAVFQHLGDSFKPYKDFFELADEILHSWVNVTRWLFHVDFFLEVAI